MTLHQLRVFITVAKLGSFTQAARSLHIVQPAVSNDVKALEKELGGKFFQRFGNKFRLTAVGEMVLREAEEIVSRVGGLRNKVDEIRGLKKGRLMVGGSALAAASFLPVAVQAFKKKHPGIEVFLKIDRSQMLEKNLLDGELDLAILGLAPGSSLLHFESYREEEVLVIAPPHHPLTRKRSVPLKLLSQQPIVIGEKGSSIVRDMVEKAFSEKGLCLAPVLEINITSAGSDAIRSAVASGLGISFIAKCLIPGDVEAGRFKVLKVPELKLKRTMYIAFHKSRQDASLAKTFAEFLKRFNAR